MKIKIQKTQLLRAINSIQNLVGRKTTMPILLNFVLKAEGEKLFIFGADIEMSGVSQVSANIEVEGSVCINAKIFSDLVRELPEGEVKIATLENNRVEIVNNTTNLKVVGTSASEYPVLSGLEHELTNTVGPSDLLDMINNTLYAASNDETRFILNGICLEMVQTEEGRISRMSATDGNRLAVVLKKLGNLDIKNKIIIPKKALTEIKKIIESEVSETVLFDVKEDLLLFQTEDTKLAVRLVDGEFPDIDVILPKAVGKKIKLSAKKLLQALRRISLLTEDLGGKCVVHRFEKEKLSLYNFGSQIGEGREEIVIENDMNDEITLGFNARFIIELISIVCSKSDNLIIELIGESESGETGKFYCEEDESSFALIMPMRLHAADEGDDEINEDEGSEEGYDSTTVNY
jgi:DNA polymerase III subunit beta